MDDSSDVSHNAGPAVLADDNSAAIEALCARVEFFDSRVYPIICDQPSKLLTRRKLKMRAIESEKTFNNKVIRRAYNDWFRFLNTCLIRINAYPEIPISHKGVKAKDVWGKKKNKKEVITK